MLIPLIPTALVNFAMVPSLPESPRWLTAKGREVQAREVLVRTCGEAAAGPALVDIKQVLATQSGAALDAEERGGEGKTTKGRQSSWGALFFDPVNRAALVIGAGTAFFQQANGSEAAVYYVPQVLRAAGVTSEHSQLQAAALVGVCKTICIVIGQFSVDVYGRRVMLLSSVAAVTASLGLLAWCLGSGGAAGTSTAGITLAALCLFMASFSLGVGPVTWVVTSEIFPLAVRSKGVAFSMALNRLTSGSVAMTFLSSSDCWAWVERSPCSRARRRSSFSSRGLSFPRPRARRSRRLRRRWVRQTRDRTIASRSLKSRREDRSDARGREEWRAREGCVGGRRFRRRRSRGVFTRRSGLASSSSSRAPSHLPYSPPCPRALLPPHHTSMSSSSSSLDT